MYVGFGGEVWGLRWMVLIELVLKIGKGVGGVCGSRDLGVGVGSVGRCIRLLVNRYVCVVVCLVFGGCWDESGRGVLLGFGVCVGFLVGGILVFFFLG